MKVAKSLLLKTVFVSILVFSHPPLISSTSLPLIRENQSEALAAQDYINFKKKVIEQSKKGWCSEAEANLIMDIVLLTKPATSVEIGTFKGSFFLPIAATLKYLKHGHSYAINSWSNEDAVQGVSPEDVNYRWWSTVNMHEAKKACISMVDEWALKPYCKIIHATPQKASYEISSIDFLHLLGGLSEEETLRNVQLYLPKVKPQGYILLSNVFLYIDEKLTKMKALWALLDECEIVCEIDHSNVILFRKN